VPVYLRPGSPRVCFAKRRHIPRKSRLSPAEEDEIGRASLLQTAKVGGLSDGILWLAGTNAGWGRDRALGRLDGCRQAVRTRPLYSKNLASWERARWNRQRRSRRARVSGSEPSQPCHGLPFCLVGIPPAIGCLMCRGGPAVTSRASPVLVRADSISIMDTVLPSPNRPGCHSAFVRPRAISKQALDLLRLGRTAWPHRAGGM